MASTGVFYSHKDTEQRELRLVGLQEVHQEANSPRQALKQAVDTGDRVGACFKLLSEKELRKPLGREKEWHSQNKLGQLWRHFLV